jgi:hypothetical protein
MAAAAEGAKVEGTGAEVTVVEKVVEKVVGKE